MSTVNDYVVPRQRRNPFRKVPTSNILASWNPTGSPVITDDLRTIAHFEINGRLLMIHAWFRRKEISLTRSVWTTSVTRSIDRLRAQSQNHELHDAYMLRHALRNLGPKHRYSQFEGQRLDPWLNRDQQAEPLPKRMLAWHYATLIQTYWVQVLAELPEEFLTNPVLCIKRLDDLQEACFALNNLSWHRQATKNRRHEQRSMALALYEASLWLLANLEVAPIPLSRHFMTSDGNDILTNRRDATRHLLLATVSHCALCCSP